MPEFPKAELCNRQGNQSLRDADYAGAISCYSQGLEDEAASTELRSVLLSNRSAAYAHLEQWRQALDDAEMCLRVRPDWGRSHACRGAALEGIGCASM